MRPAPLPTSPAVNVSSRRIYLYWLLLLVPTLAVGAAALLLLQREQARLVERTSQADAARRAAVEARTRLVAENVELLIGDIENGLLDALAAVPANELDAFLAQWEKTNPLVRTAFRSTAEAQLLRPGSTATDESARGFRRRFAAAWAARPPWTVDFVNPASSVNDKVLRREKAQEPAPLSANVANVQRARQEAQAFSKVRNYASSAPMADQLEGAPAQRKDQSVQQFTAPDRRGWAPWRHEGRLHLLGWVQPGGAGEVRGVELELAALVSRLGSVLPAEVAVREGYALRDDKARVLHQSGLLPRDGVPTLRVPLAATLLPGWDVAGFLPAAEYGASSDRGFALIGALLIGIFVIAILSGGSLLLWQARHSAEEARQKTSFVANVSHEFKTPLTTIRLYAELLEQGRVADAEKRTDYLRTIGRETQRLARLVNNALDFSRLEQGRKKFQLEPLELGAELTHLLDAHRPRLTEVGLTLQFHPPVAPLTVTTDRDALAQIVLNLLDNAGKYAATGGEVTITLAARASGVGAELHVLDRGPGVPPEHRARIFEKFHRVDDTLTAEKGGAGLGLSIARQLARGLGGDLRYAPRDGGGAAFILELP
ncbi:MAG: HAMP domain-containing histidine kinase [Opitutae bacterium]|nr:HAMP domain-containing histidine kinase [Opitutae bacterium]